MADNTPGSDNDVNININVETGGAAASTASLATQFEALRAQIDSLKIGVAGATSYYNPYTSAMHNARIAAKDLAESQKLAADGIQKVNRAAHDGHMNLSVLIREFMVLAREGSRGDVTRMAGSFSIFLRALGLSSMALLTFLGIAAVTVAPIAAITIAMHEGAEESNNFANSMRATGNYAGISRSQFFQMGEDVSKATGKSAGSLRALELQLIRTGKVSGDNIGKMVTDAALLGRAMGEKPVDAMKTLMSVVDATGGTVKQFDNKLADLNDQFHFLTLAEFKQIEAMYKHGDVAGAIGKIMDELKGNLSDQVENLGYAETAWRNLTKAIAGAWDAMMAWGRTPTNLETFNDLKQRRDIIQARLKTDSHKINDGGYSPYEADIQALARLNRSIAEVGRTMAREAYQAKVDGDKTVADSTAIDKYVHKDKVPRQKGLASKTAEDRAELEKQLNDQKLFGDNALLAEQEFWKKKVSATKAGSAQHVAAVNALAKVELDIYKKRQELILASAADDRTIWKQDIAFRVDAATDELDAQIQAKKDTISETGIYDRQSVENLKTLYAQRQEVIDKGIADALKADLDYLEVKRNYEHLMGDTQGERATASVEIAARAAADNQIRNNHIKTAKDSAALDAQVLKDKLQQYKATATQIGDYFRTTIEGLIEKTMSWSDVWISLQRKMLDFTLRALQEMLMKHLLANEQKVLSDKMAANEGGKASYMQTLTQVKNDAIKAFSGAYNATVGIPIVGPFLAPVAGATAFAAVAAMEGGVAMFSAAGGMDNVPYDNAPFLLHKNEMVLPASLATPLRNMLSSQSGSVSNISNTQSSGDTHIHVYPAPGDSIDELVSKIKKAQRLNKL